jgi:hypothetical protein
MSNLGKSIRGPIDRVPCPHCNKPNDFRVLESQQLLDTGHQCFCDYCGYSMLVTQIATVKLVAVAKDPSGKRRPVAARQLVQGQRQLPQQGKKPGFFQKLLGKG